MDSLPGLRYKDPCKRLLPDTILRNFPLFCPKCRQESIINAEHYHVITI